MITLLGLVAAAAGEPLPVDTPGQAMPDRSWDFLDLHLEVDLDPRVRAIHGVARHTLEPIGPPSAWVELHEVGLNIEKVRVDAQDASGWTVQGETLRIPVTPLPGVRTVEVQFSGTPLHGLHFRGPPLDPDVEVWSQGEDEDNRYWYPGWDYPNDAFTATIAVTTPSRYQAYATGAWVERTDLPDGRARWSYRIDRPIPNYLVAVAVADYRVQREAGAPSLEILTRANIPEINRKAQFKTMRDAMAWFERRLGTPYPFPTWRSVAAHGFLYEAMENPGLTLFDEPLLGPAMPPLRTPGEDVFVHELAHHWFGNLLHNYGWRELWLNEGFAEYYTNEWIAERYGVDAEAARVLAAREEALDDDTPLAPRGWSFDADPDEPYGEVYGRGFAVLRMLRHDLGAETFDRAIQQWISENAGRFVDSDQLRRSLEAASGRHLGWWFDAFVHHGGHAAIRTSHAWNGEKLEIRWVQAASGYTLPVDVEIATGDTIRRERVWVRPGETSFQVPMATPPTWVAVDPDAAALAAWEHEQSAAEWIGQARRSPSACARLVAIDQLKRLETSQPVLDALAEAAADAARGADYRMAAIDALGAFGADASDRLWTIAANAAPPEQARALEALSRVAQKPERASELKRLALRASEAATRAAALRAWDRTDPKGALLTLSRIVEDRSASLDERQAAMERLAEHGSPGDVKRLLRAAGAADSRSLRQIAVLSAIDAFLRLPPSQQAADRAAVEALPLETARSPDVQSRWHAVHWLSDLKTEAALSALDDLAEHDPVRAIREAAHAAAAAGRAEQKSPPEKPAADESP